MANGCSGLETNVHIASGKGLLSIQHLDTTSISEEIKELKIPRFLNYPWWAVSPELSGKTRLWNIWILSATSSVFHRCQMSLPPQTTAGKTMLYFTLSFSRETSPFLLPDWPFLLAVLATFQQKQGKLIQSHIHLGLEFKNIFLKHLN